MSSGATGKTQPRIQRRDRAVIVSDELVVTEQAVRLQPVPSPYLVNGALSDSAQRGEKIFETIGCARCHPAPLYTDLQLYDLGTALGRDEGLPIDVPQLVEVWRTAEPVTKGEEHGFRHARTKSLLFGAFEEEERGGLLVENLVTDANALQNVILTGGIDTIKKLRARKLFMKKLWIITHLVLIALFTVTSSAFTQDLKTINLPAPETTGGMPFMEVLMNRQSIRDYSPKKYSPAGAFKHSLGGMGIQPSRRGPADSTIGRKPSGNVRLRVDRRGRIPV